MTQNVPKHYAPTLEHRGEISSIFIGEQDVIKNCYVSQLPHRRFIAKIVLETIPREAFVMASMDSFYP